MKKKTLKSCIEIITSTSVDELTACANTFLHSLDVADVVSANLSEDEYKYTLLIVYKTEVTSD